MKITVVQPSYYAGMNPDKKISEFVISKMLTVQKDELMVLPEYSNAGGLSDAKSILQAMSRAKEMLDTTSKIAKDKSASISINVIEERSGSIKNSTYLFNTDGNISLVYDKIHLPPSEIKLGISYGSGECCCEVNGIRYAFMTCYDVYYSEQLEYIAKFKPDIIIVPGYQRGERTDIIRAQSKLAAFRCNAYIARSSYSMESDEYGGCSMIVAPDGNIIKDAGSNTGCISAKVDIKQKYMRSAGFGEGLIRNDDFISMGCRPEIFA